jgi:hypothetical protein
MRVSCCPTAVVEPLNLFFITTSERVSFRRQASHARRPLRLVLNHCNIFSVMDTEVYFYLST